MEQRQGGGGEGQGEAHMRNKPYALFGIGLALLVTFLDGDATVLVVIAMIAVPMFFSKENRIY